MKREKAAKLDEYEAAQRDGQQLQNDSRHPLDNALNDSENQNQEFREELYQMRTLLERERRDNEQLTKDLWLQHTRLETRHTLNWLLR